MPLSPACVHCLEPAPPGGWDSDCGSASPGGSPALSSWPNPKSCVTSRHFGLGQGGDAGVHVEIEPAVGVHVLPNQRRQRMQSSGNSARSRRFTPIKRVISSSVRNLMVLV